MENQFLNAPTVGCYDTTPTEDATGTMNSEQRTQHLEQQGTVRNYSGDKVEHNNVGWQDYQTPKRKKVRWGKVKKFFVAVVKPILVFIPNFLNAIANLKRAFTPAKVTM